MKNNLKKILIRSTLLTALNIIAALALCAYTGKTSIEAFSTTLFFIGIAYIAIGAFPLVGSYTATRDFTYQQISTISTGDFQKRSKLDNMLLDKNFLLCIKSGSVGILTIVISLLMSAYGV